MCRSSKKYTKRLKGVETLEAKTSLDFFKIDANGEKVSLNGLTRNDTDKNIRKVFGSLDDFLLTSLSSQLDSLSFIREGSTKRKEILAKFLDLEIFEKKFKLAKEDAADMKGALRRLEGREYDVEIGEAEEEHTECESNLQSQEQECAEIKQQVQELVAEIAKIDHKIESIPAEIINIAQVRHDIRNKTVNLVSAQKKLGEDKKELKDKTALVVKIDEFLEDYDITELNDKWDKYVDILSLIHI